MSDSAGFPLPAHDTGTVRVKRGLAEMLKGGVIMDVVTPEQAKIAEDAGAVAVMALERVPADIRRDGGVARMSDPELVEGIVAAVTIPVMAKARIGHFVEAQILQALGVDYVDESEVLTPADEDHHIDKWAFTVPFVCGATNLGEALRRISEGAAMIRSKGEAGTGNVLEAVRHMRAIAAGISRLHGLRSDELFSAAKELAAPYDLVAEVAAQGRLPVVLFTAGGIATPADAALMMQLGADGVFVGSGIFKSGDPARRARAIVEATTFARDPEIVAKGSRGLGEPMGGIPPVVEGLVVPGGESTVIGKLADRYGLLAPLRQRAEAGLPVLGTCAGMIFLAREVEGPPQDLLGVLDVRVRRNAFGRQVASFEAEVEVKGLDGGPVSGAFIRAPWVAEAGPDVEVLAELDGRVVAVRQGNLLATAFHPELTGEVRLHRWF